ncbi:type II secretion system protein [uncultured Fusobacterium sp.]
MRKNSGFSLLELIVTLGLFFYLFSTYFSTIKSF